MQAKQAKPTKQAKLAKPAPSRNLNLTNIILIGALVVQVLLIALIYLPSNAPVQTARGPLLSGFDAGNVTGLVIHDKDNASQIEFAKNTSGDWVFPKGDDYPLANFQVETLLGKLKALDTSRLIAQNQSSHSRLRVAIGAYERLIEIKQGSKVDKLYIGSAEGANATHMRLNDQVEVYLVSGLGSTDISVAIAGWITNPYFTLTQDDVVKVVVVNKQGTFELGKADTTWVLAGSSQTDRFNTDRMTALLGSLSSIQLVTPLGKAEQDKYGLKAPLATVTISTRKTINITPTPTSAISAPRGGNTTPTAVPATTQIVEKTYTLVIGAKQDDGNYALKSSESPYTIEIAASVAEAFTALKRDDLIIVTATPAATSAPTQVSTPAATIAATIVPTQAATQASAVGTAPATLAPTAEPTTSK